MEDVNISIYRASVVREGSTPASPGFVVSEGQNPVDPSGSGQNHLPVTIATAATGLSITDSQVLGGAGTVGQYIRGDGSLADFPESSGGGSSVSYYLNGSVAQGTIGGVAYKELNKVPVLGAGTDFTINADGYIASFITDAGDPNLLEIAAGNWNFETYFSASSNGGSPSFYVELYKVNSGGTATLIASNSTFPELIAFGTNIISYFSTLAVPTTALALTDRLAIRYYVIHSGRTITLHTEDNHLCQIITTFTTGITALNGLTAQVQNFAVGTSGTDFAIASATATHTFNLPTASATNRGALSSADWSTFNSKQNSLTNPVTGTGASGQVAYFTGTSAISSESNLFWDATNDRLGIGTAIPTVRLDVSSNINDQSSIRSINTSSSNLASARLIVENDEATLGQLITYSSGFGFNLFGINVSNYTALVTSGTNSKGLIIGTISSDPVIFGSNNTEAIRIFSGQNVHIGPTPAADNGATLQVSGTATFSSSVTLNNSTTPIIFLNTTSTFQSSGFITQHSGANRWGFGTNFGSGDDSWNIYNYTAGSRYFTVTSSGNVGIGTASPATLDTGGVNLQIKDRSALFQLAAVNSTYLSNNLYYDGSWKRIVSGYGTIIRLTDDSNGISFLTTGTGAANSGVTFTSAMNITNGGNVGIGTLSPSLTAANRTVLDINGTSNSLLVFSSGGTYKSYIYNDGTNLTTQAAVITFETNFTERMRITSAGDLMLKGRSTTTNYEAVFYNDNSQFAINANNTNVGKEINFNHRNDVTAMRITSGGNVLIGTTTSGGYKCEIQTSSTNAALWVQTGGTTSSYVIADFRTGTNLPALQVQGNGTIFMGGLGTGTVTSTSGTLSTTSDRNLKIEDGFIDSAIEKVLSLKPRYFYWNERSGLPTNIRQLGFYAQEVNEALGEEAANKPKNKNIPWGISDRSMIAMLTKAIQELKQEIDTLKN